MTLTHMKLEADLEKAKHGRWVLLIEPDYEGETGDFLPPVAVAKWESWGDADGRFMFAFYEGQAEIIGVRSAKGFVELSDMDLTEEVKA